MAIWTKLMDHQKTMVKFANKKKFVALFAEYGVGKTLCALTHIHLKNFQKTLVVSTKLSIQSTWPDEIKKHTNLKYVVLVGTSAQKKAKLEYGVRISKIQGNSYHASKICPVIFLVNYDGIKNISPELIEAEFDFIVLDESTKIKSHTTNRTKVLWALGKLIPNRMIMTGFPVTEALYDIYAQIKFLDEGETFGKSYYGFLDKYFVKTGPKYVPKRSSVKEILISIKSFCIRITNAHLNLPPKIYKTIKLEQTFQQIKLFKQLDDLFAVEFGKIKFETEYIFALIAKSLQICDGFIQHEGNIETVNTNKDAALLGLMEEIDVGKNKVIIWCSFRFSVAKIQMYLKKFGYNTLTLTGSTKDVAHVVNKFQNSKKYNILIATQKKAAESINLTNCRYAIYYSNPWSYDLRGNSEARIRRKGSEKHSSIMYIDLATKDSIDLKVLRCLKGKKDLVDVLKKEFLNLE